MNRTVLTDSIKLYGSDLGNWPESLSQAIQNDPQLMGEFQLLSAEEALFEQLLSSRSFEPHADDYAQRIIARSLADTETLELADEHSPVKNSWITHTLRPALIRPLLGMTATLIVGLAIGYNFPLLQEDTVEENFDDYTALLYVQENLL